MAVIFRSDPNLVATNIAWRVDIPATPDFIDFVIAMVGAAIARAAVVPDAC